LNTVYAFSATILHGAIQNHCDSGDALWPMSSRHPLSLITIITTIFGKTTIRWSISMSIRKWYDPWNIHLFQYTVIMSLFFVSFWHILMLLIFH